jgi:hypothetical protein
MKKQVFELQRGDKIESIGNGILTVLTVIKDQNNPNHSAIFFDNGSKYFCLTTEIIDIL